jgi:hypothetical protein
VLIFIYHRMYSAKTNKQTHARMWSIKASKSSTSETVPLLLFCSSSALRNTAPAGCYSKYFVMNESSDAGGGAGVGVGNVTVNGRDKRRTAFVESLSI